MHFTKSPTRGINFYKYCIWWGFQDKTTNRNNSKQHNLRSKGYQKKQFVKFLLNQIKF